MSKLYFILVGFVISNNCIAQNRAIKIPVSFEVVSNGEDGILNKKLVNDFGENYSITKLKFYISNVHFVTAVKAKIKNSVYLIDASKKNSISLAVPSKKINGISFLLGVDSALNCTGAQSGALDPLNDMFWTWNNGYIFFKLEGNADVSNADLHRIEQHIGGYKGNNKTMREIYLPINNKDLMKLKTLVIELDIDKYWNGINKIRLSELPVITVPGILSKNAADNFVGMFLIKDDK